MPKASRWSASISRSAAMSSSIRAGNPQAAAPDADVNVEGIGDGIILTGTVASQAEAQQAYQIASHFVATGENFVGSTGGGGGSGSGGGISSVNVGGSGTGLSTALALGSSSSSGGAGSQKIVNAIVVRGRDQIMLKVTVAEVERDSSSSSASIFPGRLATAPRWSTSTTPIRSPHTASRSAAPAIAGSFNRSPRPCRPWNRPASSTPWPSRI